MVFFAKDKQSAIAYAKQVAKKEGMRYSEPRLAKNQLPHISNWKTWSGGFK